MIFAVFDGWLLTQWINCSLYNLLTIMISQLKLVFFMPSPVLINHRACNDVCTLSLHCAIAVCLHTSRLRFIGASKASNYWV